MICHKHLNNFEYQQIKKNKLFGFDGKSRYKTNYYSIFYLFMSNSAKLEREIDTAAVIWNPDLEHVPKTSDYDALDRSAITARFHYSNPLFE